MRTFRLGMVCMTALAFQWALLVSPGAAVAEDYNWNPNVGPINNHDRFLWDDANNWTGGAVPVDGNSIYVRDKAASLPANIIMDLDIGAGVFLPNSDARFASNKLDLVSTDGNSNPGGGTLTLKSISANLAGGYPTTFRVPVVCDVFYANAATIASGGSLDANTLELKTLTVQGPVTIGQVNAVATGGRSVTTISGPLTIKPGGTGNTYISGVGYTSTDPNGVLVGGSQDVVTIAQYLTSNRDAGGSSLKMVKQNTMPSSISVGGVTCGFVIDDANTLVYSGGGQNITFADKAAFRDTSDAGNPNTGGTYPTVAQLGGNLLWYAVDVLNSKNTTYTLVNNTADANSPFKGFALGVWSTASNGRATLQMGPGDIGNMQVMLGLPSINYNAYTDDDMTFKHNGDPNASTTVDFWVEVGGKFSKFNGQAITNGETNLMDTFHFHAMLDGMRISQTGQNYAGQTWIFDAGRLAIGAPASLFPGELKFINGGAFWFDGTFNASATTKLTFEADSWLSINNINSLENLTADQVDFADGAVLSYRGNLDTDSIGVRLGSVIAKAEFRVDGSPTFSGSGLVLGPGRYIGGSNGGSSDQNIYGTIKAAPDDDLRVASFGREFRLYGTFDAGTKDLVCGSLTELPTAGSFSENQNSTGPRALVYEIPDNRVDIRDEATIIAGGMRILSGNVRLWQDLSLARLHIQSGANLNFFSSPAPVVAVTGTLSGGGNWATSGGSVVLAAGATVAPGESIGILNNGGGALTLESGAIYEWQLAAATGTAGTEWDLLKGSSLTFEGDLVFKVDDSLFSGTLDGTETFVVASFGSITGFDSGNVSFILPSGWSGGLLGIDGQDLVLTALATTTPGDTNGDGVVDAADYITLKQNFGTATGGGASAGDFDETGTVDWADLSILMANMGAGGPAPATIPEPATLGLLALGALAMLRRRRK